jgi:1,2-diacylglycerol 3-alpha-glucosyltransferase
MKIGVFTDSYRPYVSGVVCSIDTFSRELMRRGHEIYIFAPRYPRNRGVSEVNIFRFPSFRTPFYPEFYIGLPLPWKAKKSVQEYNLDIIHVQSPFMIGYLGATFARKLGIPLIFTYHTLYDQYTHYIPFAGDLAQRAVISIARDFCNRCDAVVTPTGVIKKLIQSYGVTSPIVTIPTGIQTEHFRDGDPNFLRREFGMHPEEKVLLYVGRLGKEKNLEYLMHIFQLVHQKRHDVTLALVGSGPEKDGLKSLADDLGISEKVLFTGLIPPAKVAGVYMSADIFVFPSITETQGLVLAEAMAAGLPVVAQAAYGSLAMVENGVNGYLCEEGKDHFAEQVVTLLSDPILRRKMGEAGKIRASRLSAEKMAIRLESLYQAMIDGSAEEINHLAKECV